MEWLYSLAIFSPKPGAELGHMNNFAKVLRNNATDLERLLRSRQLGGFRFRRQRPIGPYVCDFVCLTESVVVELDGSQHIEQAAYDARRDDFLRSNGFRVLRFWNGDVMQRLETVLDTIHEALYHEEMDGRLE
jgi:very-short-patch-repair endonuclease